MPARIDGAASGSSIARRRSRGDSPSASAACAVRIERREPGVRVAHDRQQRVERQRHQRRQRADRPQRGDQEREQRKRRNGLDHAHGGEHALAERGVPRSDHAERNADAHRRRERDEDEHQMLARESPEVGPEQRIDETAPRAAAGSPGDTGEEAVGGCREGLAVELRCGIHAHHRRCVDASLAALQSHARPPEIAAAHRAGRRAQRRSAETHRGRPRAYRRRKRAILASVV